MNPRDSIPQTRSKVPGSTSLAIAAIVDWSPFGFCSSGVMSLNRIPFFGKSGTSRMYGSIKTPPGTATATLRGQSTGRRTESEEGGRDLRPSLHFLGRGDAEEAQPVGDHGFGRADES